MNNYVIVPNFGIKSDTETGSYQTKKSPALAAVLRIGADTVLSSAVRIKVYRTARNVQIFPATT